MVFEKEKKIKDTSAECYNKNIRGTEDRVDAGYWTNHTISDIIGIGLRLIQRLYWMFVPGLID
ncbi:hypothetical protein FACS189419_09870 [Planctomycetales bacterium]|nr:hypothetical protein FACS189419_09870 [Planctomycetales bacterium]